MRTQPNAPAAKTRHSKRQRESDAATAAPKRRQPVLQPLDDEVRQDDAPELTLTDIETAEERGADSVETLPELEREIGISDWIDPQTGEPAEGQSPPHLEEE